MMQDTDLRLGAWYRHGSGFQGKCAAVVTYLDASAPKALLQVCLESGELCEQWFDEPTITMYRDEKGMGVGDRG